MYLNQLPHRRLGFIFTLLLHYYSPYTLLYSLLSPSLSLSNIPEEAVNIVLGKQHQVAREQ